MTSQERRHLLQREQVENQDVIISNIEGWQCEEQQTASKQTTICLPIISNQRNEMSNQSTPSSSAIINGSSVNINEFRDTIGICQIRPMFEHEGESKDAISFYDLTKEPLYNLQNNSHEQCDTKEASVSKDKSLVSINKEIVEILSDLEGILDDSISNKSDISQDKHSIADKDTQPEQISPKKDDLTRRIDTKSDSDSFKVNFTDTDDSERGECRNVVEDSIVNESREERGCSIDRDLNNGESNRRNSMRYISPLHLPSAPSPSPPPELSLSAQLFLEMQDPVRYSQMRTSSATIAPRERGRRALSPRRCESLHVHPRSTESTSTSSSSSTTHSSPFHVITSHREDSAHPPQQRTDNILQERKEEWPLRGGAAMALLSCTLSGYSVCRFSLLTLDFGGNFVVQFLLLSILFGMPLLCLFASFGRILNAGPFDSWRVAPLFRGIGISLVFSQVLIAAYYVAGISWLLVYFRDSFVSHSGLYRWADGLSGSLATEGVVMNSTAHIPLLIPAYLSEVVLRRGESPTLPFQSLFHICLLWMIVALILSKGLASYGKVVFVLTLVPILCLCAVSIRFLSISPSTLRGALPYTNWGEFFINSKSWSAAAEECFMTWALFAPTVWSLCGSPVSNPSRCSPLKDLLPAFFLTLLTLLCGILITGSADVIIREHLYYYTSTSYEHPSWWVFLTRERGSYPRHATHHSLLLGVCVGRAGTSPDEASGLQPLRLATEIFPAVMALLSTSTISSFWSIIFYGSLIFLCVSQMAVLVWGITASIIEICPRALSSRRGILSLSCCAGLLLASLPLARGLELVHLLDYSVVGVWWQCLLQVVTLAVFFLIRGRPYAADALAFTFLSPTSSFVPLLAFTWNVLLPIAMIVECVIAFRIGRYRQVLMTNGQVSGYWLGVGRIAIILLQLIPLLLVPLGAFIQCWRYLTKGPPDILDRIQLLYRPLLDENGRVVRMSSPASSINSPAPVPTIAQSEPPSSPADPPPKYTPPPSYSTATGARLTKLFTNSIRRSIRRVQRRFINTSDEGNSSGSNQMRNSISLRQVPFCSGSYRSMREKKSRFNEQVQQLRLSLTLPRRTQSSDTNHHSSVL